MAGRNKAVTSLAWLIGLAAIAVRLIAITQPFIDNWSWRESDVAAIARNFLESGFRFAYPQIDWAGDAAGYVGTEFPLLPFTAALIYKFAGVHEWIGRLETVLFFAASLPVFYLLVRRIFSESVALWALFFYSFAPLSIAASRAFIPDLPSLSLSLAGLYFFLRWVDDNDRWGWLISSIALSLAILIKGTSAIIGLPLLYLAAVAAPNAFGVAPMREGADRQSGKECDGQRPPLQKTLRELIRSPELWLFTAIALLPSIFWYWHAWQISMHYYPYHFFGAGGFEIMNFRWYADIFWRLFTRSLTPIVSFLALGGIFILPREKYGRVFHWWLGVMIVFVLFIGYGNRHPWYQLPLVPIVAVFAGMACHAIAKRIERRFVRQALAMLIVLMVADFSFQYARAFYNPSSSDLYDVALRVREVTPGDARIVAADGGDPTLFYYAHRKGWHFLEKNGIWQGPPLDSAEAISNLEKLRGRGATYLVLPFRTRWWLDYYNEFSAHLKQSAEPIEVTPRFAIYKLDRGK